MTPEQPRRCRTSGCSHTPPRPSPLSSGLDKPSGCGWRWDCRPRWEVVGVMAGLQCLLGLRASPQGGTGAGACRGVGGTPGGVGAAGGGLGPAPPPPGAGGGGPRRGGGAPPGGGGARRVGGGARPGLSRASVGILALLLTRFVARPPCASVSSSVTRERQGAGKGDGRGPWCSARHVALWAVLGIPAAMRVIIQGWGRFGAGPGSGGGSRSLDGGRAGRGGKGQGCPKTAPPPTEAPDSGRRAE